MDNKLRTILDELYLIDPSLREHEQEVVSVLERMISARPDTKCDENFVKRVRSELMSRAAVSVAAKPPVSLLSQFHSMKKFFYVVSGAAICAVLLIPIMYYRFSRPPLPIESDLALGPVKQEVRTIAKNAFGSLKTEGGSGFLGTKETLSSVAPTRDIAVSRSFGNDSVRDNVSTNVVEGFGGGGGTSASPSAPVSGSAVSDGSQGSSMPPYEYPSYRFVYKGDPITINEDELSVLRRIKSTERPTDVIKLISGFKLPGIDLKKFTNNRLRMIETAQDEDFGYIINAQFDEGVVFISQNWLRWPQSDATRCGGDAVRCIQPYDGIKPSEVLSNDELISIAKQFVIEKGIDMSYYGDPEVSDDWRIMYETAQDKSSVYIPESMSVSFPLLIDGKKVFEDSGISYGINISIDIRQKKVTNVNSITTQTYEGSSYAVEKDVKKIINFAEQGGNTFGMFYGPSGANIHDINLGTPSLMYMRYFKYNYEKGTGDDLFVPALVFPLSNIPGDQPFYQKNIVVPIVKEILDEKISGGGVVPLIEKSGIIETLPSINPVSPESSVEGGAGSAEPEN